MLVCCSKIKQEPSNALNTCKILFQFIRLEEIPEALSRKIFIVLEVIKVNFQTY